MRTYSAHVCQELPESVESMDHAGGRNWLKFRHGAIIAPSPALVVLRYGGYKDNHHITVSLSPMQARMTADFLHAMADKVDDGEFVELDTEELKSLRDSEFLLRRNSLLEED